MALPVLVTLSHKTLRTGVSSQVREVRSPAPDFAAAVREGGRERVEVVVASGKEGEIA